MPLQPCRECRLPVSTEAATCPRCGCPNPTTVATNTGEAPVASAPPDAPQAAAPTYIASPPRPVMVTRAGSPYAASRPQAGTGDGWARGSQVRPWSRWFARITDYWIFHLAVGFFFVTLSFVIPVLASSPLSNLSLWLEGILMMFFWMLVEPFLLSAWGTTPGKWLLGIRVRARDGSKLSLESAFDRSFKVWVYGMGFGLPLVSLVTWILSYNELDSKEVTKWDARSGYRVQHRGIGTGKAVFLIALWVFMIVITTILFTLPPD